MSRRFPIVLLLLAQACTVTPTDRARVSDVPKPAAAETAPAAGADRAATTGIHYTSSSALSGGGGGGSNGAAIGAAVAAALIMVDAVLSTLGRGEAEQGRKQAPEESAPAK